MKPIILHIGDRVHHKTLGHGIVIAVEEDFCTARFGEKEANFRIPEAFVRGFLASEDARIGSDETEEQPIEETISEGEKQTNAKKINKAALATFIIMGVFALTPFLAYYIWHYGKTGEVADAVGIICFIIAFFIYIPFAVKLSKVSGTVGVHKSKTGLDSGTELMAGMMGAELINREMRREKEAAEKRRYDSLYWQESIRDKNPRHDFDYDHKDDWLGTD